MDWLKMWARGQLSDNSMVVPEHRWSAKDLSFFLNSPAGLIKYKPRSAQDAARFRDLYINRFESITNNGSRLKDFHELYREIGANERVSYSANLNARLKGLKCKLSPA